MATTRIVLVGGGHGHVQVIKSLHRLARPAGVSITLIDPQAAASYSGMMPGCVAELYEPAQTQIQLAPLAARSDIEFMQTRVVSADAEAREVVCEDGSRVGYDVCSFDVGSVTAGASRVPGVADFAIATRPISELEVKIRAKEAEMLAAGLQRVRVAVVGCGAAGVELALALHGRWRGKFETVEVTMMSSHAGVLLEAVPHARSLVTEHLLAKGFEIRENAVVASVEEGAALLAGGDRVEFDVCLWATGAEHQPFTRGGLSGVQTEANGFIVVDSTLRSVTAPDVFAVGDCASITPNPAPKAGVYSVRSGPVLLENLLKIIAAREAGDAEPPALTEFAPQRDFLRLLSTGDGSAIGIKFGFSFEGRWVWGLKDAIDTGFMRLFDVALLPEPTADVDTAQYDAAADQPPPRCGLAPAEAARLLCASQDAEDFEPMNLVLKHMADSPEFCAEVVAAVEEEFPRSME